jgi:hypothetical protein
MRKKDTHSYSARCRTLPVRNPIPRSPEQILAVQDYFILKAAKGRAIANLRIR